MSTPTFEELKFLVAYQQRELAKNQRLLQTMIDKTQAKPIEIVSQPGEHLAEFESQQSAMRVIQFLLGLPR